jgi:phospholipid transport system substrate-binding protein
VTNYRSSFANEIRNGGMEQLINNLAERNAKVKA